ncbi:hypothetical protein OE749_13335 [Aestuariibacter sp. AA17]|uniref:Uncharacterized protein n=1 Tax=Fluctibacter corallii TaxID=2984329 RepID=A0ABT3AAI1_9ALTE|nr:hypothetical protein [Aestuariibacter sp. AA17]MCV2885675.1 hypothetical protein [Aestuariibacter sp. AA17]
MACLTRKLQKTLTQYLKQQSAWVKHKQPETIRAELVDKGVCPSDVTKDQFRHLVKQAVGGY